MAYPFETPCLWRSGGEFRSLFSGNVDHNQGSTLPHRTGGIQQSHDASVRLTPPRSHVMEDSLKQALADFELFLAGSRAPALIGHSLATVVGQDVRVVASAVSRWVYSSPNATYDRFSALVAARNK